MRSTIKYAFLTLLLVLVTASTLIAADLSSDEVISLKEAGFSESFMASVIEASTLNLSVDEMIKMKSAEIEESTILKVAIKESSSEIETTKPETTISEEDQKLLNGDFSVKQLYVKKIEFFTRDDLGIPGGKLKNVILKYDETGLSDNILLEFELDKETQKYIINSDLSAVPVSGGLENYVEDGIREPYLYWDKGNVSGVGYQAFIGFLNAENKREKAFEFHRSTVVDDCRFATHPEGEAILVMWGSWKRRIVGAEKSHLLKGSQSIKLNPDDLHRKFQYSSVWSNNGRYIYIADRNIGKKDKEIFARLTLGIDPGK